MDRQLPLGSAAGTANPRIPQLDGLRGVAVLMVVWAHSLGGVFPSNVGWWPAAWGWGIGLGSGGGYVGVQLFFVLSGFLITRLLQRELAATGRIRFSTFYLCRIRRLYPALMLTSGAYVCLALALPVPHSLGEIAGAVFRALTYTTNLHDWLHGIPDSLWLSHTWTLAVEEQFYLVWPLLFVLTAGRCYATPSRIAGLVIGLTLLFRAVAPAHISYEILRFDALMLGCLMGLHPKWRTGKILQGTGIGVVLVYLLFPPQPFSSRDYLLSAIGAAGFLQHALATNWMSSRVLCYFGRISYGLYLWHMLILRTGLHPICGIPLAVGISHLSFYHFEVRFMLKRETGPSPV